MPKNLKDVKRLKALKDSMRGRLNISKLSEKSKNFVGYSNAETVKTSEIPRTAEIFKQTSGECASSRQASKRDDETVEA